MKKILLALLLLSQSLMAEDNIFIIIAKKQEEKRKNSWSLSDWMQTKKKIALMDQWLAMNSSPNNFEFSLGGYEKKYKPESDTGGVNTIDSTKTLDAGEFAAYYKIFGLSTSYGKSNEKTSFYDAQMNLRIFGTSIQSTNITTHFGRKHFNLDENFDNYYWGGSSSLYLLSFLGVEANYSRYLGAENSKKTRLQGQILEPGVFLDLFILRISATYSKEVLDTEANAVTTRETRKGWKYGVKVFF